MAQNISPRRGAAIAGFAALVLLVAVAAFDNQWLNHWRTTQSADGGNATHSWFAGPVRGLSAVAWRATKQAGEPGRVFFGMLAEPLIAVVVTFLLLMLVCRGVGAERGRWPLFLGSWFATGLAAAVALIAGSGIAGTGIAGGQADVTGSTYFGRGEIYYTLISLGLAFGLFAGWLVGFTAVLVYGSTESSEDVSTTREYEYASSASAAPSSLSSSATEDYSFSPTSPYASSESSSYGYESANALTEFESPTQIASPTQMRTPSQESDPYGGARY